MPRSGCASLSYWSRVVDNLLSSSASSLPPVPSPTVPSPSAPIGHERGSELVLQVKTLLDKMLDEIQFHRLLYTQVAQVVEEKECKESFTTALESVKEVIHTLRYVIAMPLMDQRSTVILQLTITHNPTQHNTAESSCNSMD
jgi:hypothetical protein